MNRPERDAFLTVPETARRTKVGERQWRRAIQRGELSVYLVGSWPRVRWTEALAWLECQRRPQSQRHDRLPGRVR